MKRVIKTSTTSLQLKLQQPPELGATCNQGLAPPAVPASWSSSCVACVSTCTRSRSTARLHDKTYGVLVNVISESFCCRGGCHGFLNELELLLELLIVLPIVRHFLLGYVTTTTDW